MRSIAARSSPPRRARARAGERFRREVPDYSFGDDASRKGPKVLPETAENKPTLVNHPLAARLARADHSSDARRALCNQQTPEVESIRVRVCPPVASNSRLRWEAFRDQSPSPHAATPPSSAFGAVAPVFFRIPTGASAVTGRASSLPPFLFNRHGLYGLVRLLQSPSIARELDVGADGTREGRRVARGAVSVPLNSLIARRRTRARAGLAPEPGFRVEPVTLARAAAVDNPRRSTSASYRRMKSARRSRAHALRRSRAARAARRRSVFLSAVRGRVATFASVDAFPSSSPFAAPFFFALLAARRRPANARFNGGRVGARRRRDPRRREVTHPRSPPDGTLPREPNARESPTGARVDHALRRRAGRRRAAANRSAAPGRRRAKFRLAAAHVARESFGGSRPRHRRTPSIVVCAAPPSLALRRFLLLLPRARATRAAERRFPHRARARKSAARRVASPRKTRRASPPGASHRARWGAEGRRGWLDDEPHAPTPRPFV